MEFEYLELMRGAARATFLLGARENMITRIHKLLTIKIFKKFALIAASN